MQKLSMLIVDDSETARYLLRRVLAKLDCAGRVFEADDGETGIDFFADFQKKKNEFPDDFPPILVFLDINMPLLNGFGFLEKFEELKNQFDLTAVNVLMYTSSDRQEDIDRATSFDSVRGFITKGKLNSKSLEEKILAAVGIPITT